VRAHFLTLVARTGDASGDERSGHRGISLFIVDTSLPGVSISRKLEKLGMWSSDTAEISLDDVAVPADELIGGSPNQGFAQLMWQLQYERLAGAAACVGHAAQTLEETIEYARGRRTFGPHRAPGHRLLADAARRLEAARALLH
jgi:alkylation response protein AidB-like acyl-CoA dehydrogenase